MSTLHQRTSALHQATSSRPDPHRLLPQAADAERGTLCSLLQWPREIGGLCMEKQIKAGHFHLPAHALIFTTLMELWEAGRPIDFITLTQLFRDRGQLEEAGGAVYVTELFTFLPTAANAGYYLGILQEKFTLREIIKVCTEYAARSYEEQDQEAALLDELEAKVMAIRRNDDSELREVEPKALIMDAIADIEAHYTGRGAITGLATGFPALDEMTDGLHPGEMIVIAARPSMGKTALAMSIAEHIALESRKTVAFFSLEMSDQSLMKRALLSRARVNMHRVRMGFLEDRDFPALTAAAEKIAEGGRLRIVDAMGATVGAIRAKARRMLRRHPDLAAVFVDYLQIARSVSKQAQGCREREIGEISAGLKSLAKELNLPVIVLAQLNRDVEKRTGEGRGRPRLADLRESGTIEQDADLVALLYREEAYADSEEAKLAVEGRATLIIAKQRNGPVGDVPLTFLKEYARYEPRASEPGGWRGN